MNRTEFVADKDKVVICDDDQARAEAWKESVSPFLATLELDVAVLDAESFAATLEMLEERQLQARTDSSTIASADNVLDTAAALFVDFDLAGFGEPVNGEEVAYLARCYSECGLIIGLNRFSEGQFDLTLTGQLDSFSDLDIGGMQLPNPGLWGNDFVGFRPWSWPLLLNEVAQFENRVREIAKSLDESVLEFFGLQEEDAPLPRSIAEFIGVTRPASEVTVQEFVEKSGQGLNPKDRLTDPLAVARVAAARLHKWLELMVLSGQHLLIDAPHLALRHPGLLSNDLSALETWDQTTSLDVKGLEAVLKLASISQFRFEEARPWLSRPSWSWLKIQAAVSDGTLEIDESPNIPDFVFCEDLARFAPREAAKEFVADVPSPYVRRFVLDQESNWAANFLGLERAKEGWGDSTDPSQMEYRPAARFAL